MYSMLQFVNLFYLHDVIEFSLFRVDINFPLILLMKYFTFRIIKSVL